MPRASDPHASSPLATSRDDASSVSGTPGSNARPKFPKDTQGFYSELRNRVDAYFAVEGRRPQDCWQMYLKTAVILAWLGTSYALLVFVVPMWWLAAPLAISLAFAISAVGFSIQHDAGHHAYSRYGWVNRMAAMSLDMIGASSYLWRWKHVVFHHTYPNVDGQDTDIEPGAIARLSPNQPRHWFHRWQHLYLWPVYGLTAARWHLYGDFKDVVLGAIGPHRIPRPRGWDLVVFLVGKAVSIMLLIGIPMLVHPWWVVMCFYMVVTIVVGIVLTVVFQLAHCVSEADFPQPEANTRMMEDSWAVHQLRTTVDFARNSRLLSWLLGGLNFQIEHHLFPKICHIHYPALSRIVEGTCKEYDVQYSAHNSFLSGLGSHYRWLKTLGEPAPSAVA